MPISFIVLTTIVIVACIAGLIVDHLVRKERKEARLRMAELNKWALGYAQPIDVHTPCGLGCELYKSGNPDWIYVVCCYGAAESCDGKQPECATCPLRDHGIDEARDGWTPVEEMQPF